MKYIGTELELFGHASNWKAYWASILHEFIKGRVLEVGAGIGTSTTALSSCKYESWTCLEPDPELVLKLSQVLDHSQSAQYEIITGTIADIKPDQNYNTVLYLDVLEHIKDDHIEIQKAARLLSENGLLLILGPAHQWLYSEFDSAIGHFRRYNKNTLMKIIPDDLQLIKFLYLDSMGLFASLANRIFLHESNPDKRQIEFWDKVLVPCSRITDYLFLHKFGKTVIGIWQKNKSVK